MIGYPPEDLVLRPSVVDKCHQAVDALIRESHSGPALIATTPWREGGAVYNAAILIDKGAFTVRFKSDLPNYGVFDEKRVFAAGPIPEPVNFRGTSIGVPVCEDIWTPGGDRAPGARRRGAAAGAERLAVRDGKILDAARAGEGSRARDQPARGVRQPGGRARTSWCSMAARS